MACPECNGPMPANPYPRIEKVCDRCHERLEARSIREQMAKRDMKRNGEWMGTLNTDLFSVKETKGRKKKKKQ